MKKKEKKKMVLKGGGGGELSFVIDDCSSQLHCFALCCVSLFLVVSRRSLIRLSQNESRPEVEDEENHQTTTTASD